jgi:hypothetical protein
MRCSATCADRFLGAGLICARTTPLARLKSILEEAVSLEDHMEGAHLEEEDITAEEDITEGADFAEEHFAGCRTLAPGYTAYRYRQRLL